MIKKNIFLIIILFFISSCGKGFIKKEDNSGISGVVIYNKIPQSGISVFAYKNFSSGLKGDDYAAYCDSTNTDGKFLLNLPAGSYIITARSKSSDDNFFCYYGGNPVTVSFSNFISLHLNLVKTSSWIAIGTDTTQTTGIFGLVMNNSSPLAGAKVSAYLNSDTYFRGPGFSETYTDESGSYSLELPVGKYYIVVHKRNSQDDLGPIKTGDYFGYYENNPILIKDKQLTVFINTIVKEKSTIEDSIITTSGTFLKKSSYISGKIVDNKGNPVSGVFAALYPSENIVEKPLFLSEKSDNDGKYKIYVNISGKYFLGARSVLGFAPKKDEYLGWYIGTHDHSIEIVNNEVKDNVVIVVEPVPSSGE